MAGPSRGGKRLSHLPKELRPREKAKAFGLNILDERELLALIISSGTANFDVLTIVDNLFQRYGCLYNMQKATSDDFSEISGISKVQGLRLASVFEIAKRLKQAQTPEQYNPEKASAYALSNASQEEVLSLFLYDKRGTFLGYRELMQGNDASLSFDFRFLFHAVLKHGATKFVLVHNHPSGSLLPSKSDLLTTNLIAKEARKLGLRLLDHLIVNSDGYFSFLEHQMMEK